MKKLLLLLLCFFTLTLNAQEISIIPKPAMMDVQEGAFLLNGKVAVCYPKSKDKSLKKVVDNFVSELEEATGLKLVKCNKEGKADVVVRVNECMADEGYKLSVTPKGIEVVAAKPAGLFYAFQTLKQLMPRNVMAGMPDETVKEWSIPCVDIADEPRFSWRGFMLDEGRHFYGKEEIKKIIDVMAAYKMNRFHWHLTEDQGWRIEIKKYPKLTEIGAWRDSKVCAWGDVKPDGIRYGGFYTHEEIKEVVAYAKERFEVYSQERVFVLDNWRRLEAFGAKGFSVTNTDELHAAMKEAVETNGTVLIDCAIHMDERVLPMIPPGGAIENMILS